MAKRVDPDYPWKEWFARKGEFTLHYQQDYWCSTPTFASLYRWKAWQHNRKASICQGNGQLTIKNLAKGSVGPPKVRGDSYPWDKWFKRAKKEELILQMGIHFEVATSSFATAARVAAKRKGLKIRIGVKREGEVNITVHEAATLVGD